jgi:hypothetical protein
VTEPPIISVTLDENGKSSYRIGLCGISTRDYGEIFATLVRLVAKMIATEGHYDEKDIEHEILQHFNQEVREPTTHTSMNQLQ